MNLDQILEKIPDKFENRWTTSKKFKSDLYNFFNLKEFEEKNCAELGVYNGHTTLILCNLFKHVNGIEFGKKQVENSINFLNSMNIKNYNIINEDLYNGSFPDVGITDIFFIDAVHEYNNVKIDTNNCLKVKSVSKKYIIYDDYGGFPEVKKAVDEFINKGILKICTKIGCEPNSNFTRKLLDFEGVICIEN